MNYSPTTALLIIGWTILIVLGSSTAQAQNLRDTIPTSPKIPFLVDERPLQISVLPGVGKNSGEGVHYANYVSLNLLYGLSGANYSFMYSTFINRNLYYVSGLQISGILNQIQRTDYGVRNKLYEDSPFRENLEGAQLTGGVNFVGRDATGAQIAGVQNNVIRDLNGVQVAGIGNRAGRFTSGFQIAGLYNIGIRNMHGAQISLGINFTQGNLRGLQLGLYNRAKLIDRSPAHPLDNARTFQIGLVNTTKSLAGHQIGLINITRKLYGMQVGIINIYRGGPYQGESGDKLGAPIGLLNTGTGGGLLAFYTDESLMLGGELTTGNCTNCKWSASQMPFDDRFMKYIHNAIVVQYDINNINPQVRWKIGYGIDRVHFNKHSYIAQDPKNKRIQLRYGMRLLRVLYDEDIAEVPTYELKLRAEAGYRLLGSYFFFSGLINGQWLQEGSLEPEINAPQVTLSETLHWWPGLMMGIRM